ncbi:hypothetical protein SporoP37_00710 [Sporosarcina sp. P37]|uniref:hypothetical protein n=1 Tax=unclassified Sporosarcina TaxID=2647733 RepID=UPI0009BD04FC|nr:MULTISPECIES: hypothetical protein [unclassified Sporosarcina]ARD46828.1 hypothetical protein SporoP33_00305 [Sporosarcina sp. P33]ARK23355.1 hypothetical protein SporoP37_00710 [Sporosarcina sp. P37]PID19608.1 hypothetical protein CSV62_03665 [Sporosarcina sp. P35]
MKITSTHVWTAIMAAVLSVIALKFLKVFKFIKWSPVGWTKKFQMFAETPGLVKWILLWVICFVLFFILYFIARLTFKIPPTLSSLIVTVIAIFFIEWMIHVKADLTMTQFIKKISIPFACLFAMIFRFVIGTSVYMRKTFG